MSTNTWGLVVVSGHEDDGDPHGVAQWPLDEQPDLRQLVDGSVHALDHHEPLEVRT